MSTAIVLACGGITAVALTALVVVGKGKPLSELVFPLLYYVYTSRLGWHVHQAALKKARQPDFRPHSCVVPPTAGEATEQPMQVLARKGIAVEPVPMLSDNYAYLIIDRAARCAVAVDPCDPAAVSAAAEVLGVRITAILTTHYHWDHAGGNHALVQHAREAGVDIVVVGSEETSRGNASSCVNRIVQDGELFQVGRLCFSAMHTPGHTKTDVTFLLHHLLVEPTSAQQLQAAVSDATSWSLFTGDVVFGGGCGKFFELPARHMYKSLQRIGTVHSSPDRALATLVWPGHEYALNNLRFAVQEEPHNEQVAARLHDVEQKRTQGITTVPSTLAQELETNLFLRSCCQSAADLSPDVAVAHLQELRTKKNKFKG